MEEKNYFKLILYVVGTLGAFGVAVMAFYFGIVALFTGVAIVEGDVMADFKYVCANTNESQSTCTNYTTTLTDAYTDYQSVSDGAINLLSLFLNAIGIVFTFIGLVLLMAVLKTTGLIGGKKRDMNKFE